MIRLLLSALLLLLASCGTVKANDQNPSPGVIPMTSPWDANAWEPGGADSFWRVIPAKKPTPVKNGEKTAVVPSTAPKAALPPKSPSSKNFSNRQSEK